MTLEKTVIAFGLNNLSDARFFAGMGVNYLVFDPQKNINAQAYQEIINWVAGAKIGIHVHENQDISQFESEVFITNSLHIAEKLFEQNASVIYQTDFAELKSNIACVFDLPFLAIIVENFAYEDVEEIKQMAQNQPIAPCLSLFSAQEAIQIAQDPAFHTIALAGSGELKAGFRALDHSADILEALETQE